MCGIAGIAGEMAAASVDMVAAMLRQLERRGPDDEGVEAWPNAVLAHRRLSIFDLSPAGHQPMLTPERDIGIVFNGAIYNFKDLRAELESDGCRFRSESDTEVLLLGYRNWGIDRLLEKIDGMFAFAIWDDREQTLYLVRDRLGVKPLAYSATSKGIAFASTIRALKRAGIAGDLNREAVLEYLEFGFITDEHAIYNGVSKVPAGSYLKWVSGEVTVHSYWKPPDISENKRISYGDAVDEAERLFLLAVEKRLQADVPVGALLSGGIDSSLVCWAIARLGGKVKAFSVGTPDDPVNESGVAAETARRLGIEHETLEISQRKRPDPRLLASAFAEPFACSSALGMLSIAELVKSSATVLLTGDGGDDVFLGYPEHRNFLLAQKLSRIVPESLAELWNQGRNGHSGRGGSLKRIRSLLDYSTGGLGAVTNARDGLPFYIANKMLTNGFGSTTISHREIEWSHSSAKQLLPEFLSYDRRTRFIGEYLPKVDGSTMYYGLEARSPFLDIDLWNFAASLPFELRLRRFELKSILREIVRKRIGPELARKRKQGFSVPAENWLAGEWKNDFIEALTDGYVERSGFVDSKAALRAFDRCLGASNVPRQFWFIFVLDNWLRFEAENA